ncbi:hypothetical protein [Parafilimonas sp.]|uniref:hypothetical protein n=1 Tax=Parafilimonas sp. TaxID=1969739 RepID=UPI0039E33CDA
MKRLLLFLLMAMQITGLSCKKDNSQSQTDTARGFTIYFDKKEYIGLDSANIQTGVAQYKGVSLRADALKF